MLFLSLALAHVTPSWSRVFTSSSPVFSPFLVLCGVAHFSASTKCNIVHQLFRSSCSFFFFSCRLCECFFGLHLGLWASSAHPLMNALLLCWSWRPCRLCSRHPQWTLHEIREMDEGVKKKGYSSKAALGGMHVVFFHTYFFECVVLFWCFINLILSVWAFALTELYEQDPLFPLKMLQGYHFLWCDYVLSESFLQLSPSIIVWLHIHGPIMSKENWMNMNMNEWKTGSGRLIVREREKAIEGGLVLVYWVNLFM